MRFWLAGKCSGPIAVAGLATNSLTVEIPIPTAIDLTVAQDVSGKFIKVTQITVTCTGDISQ